MKSKIKIIMAFLVGLMISVVVTSVYAATVIAASEVSYTDNKSMGATNVSAALDKTIYKYSTLNTKVTTLKNEVTPIGTIIKPSSYTTSIPSGTVTTFGSMSLPKGGVYFVTAYSSWTQSFAGLDIACLNNSCVRNKAGSGGGISVTNIYDTTSAATTVNCNAYQASGSTRTLNEYVCTAVRIK